MPSITAVREAMFGSLTSGAKIGDVNPEVGQNLLLWVPLFWRMRTRRFGAGAPSARSLRVIGSVRSEEATPERKVLLFISVLLRRDHEKGGIGGEGEQELGHRAIDCERRGEAIDLGLVGFAFTASGRKAQELRREAALERVTREQPHRELRCAFKRSLDVGGQPLSVRVGLRSILARTKRADRVELFEAEADAVDQVVTAAAGGIIRMRSIFFAGCARGRGSDLLGEAIERARGRRRERRAEHCLADED